MNPERNRPNPAEDCDYEKPTPRSYEDFMATDFVAGALEVNQVPPIDEDSTGILVIINMGLANSNPPTLAEIPNAED